MRDLAQQPERGKGSRESTAEQSGAERVLVSNRGSLNQIARHPKAEKSFTVELDKPTEHPASNDAHCSVKVSDCSVYFSVLAQRVPLLEHKFKSIQSENAR